MKECSKIEGTGLKNVEQGLTLTHIFKFRLKNFNTANILNFESTND